MTMLARVAAAGRFRKALPFLPYHGIGLLIAAAVKWFYRGAGADDLNWILEPTCRLAGLLSGIGFERELRIGWVSHSHRMIVGPGCAGLNFLVIAFSTFYFPLVHRPVRAASRAAWLGASLGAAYLLTIGGNALRILVATLLLDANLHAGVITPARVHRLEGVAIYSLALLLAYLAIERVARPRGWRRERRGGSPLVPLGWYLGFTVAIPLLSRAFRHDPALFLEHTATVAAGCVVVGLAALAIRRIGAGAGSRPDGPRTRVRSRFRDLLSRKEPPAIC